MIRPLLCLLLLCACGGTTPRVVPTAPGPPQGRSSPPPPSAPSALVGVAPSPPEAPAASIPAAVTWLEGVAALPAGRCADVAAALRAYQRDHGSRPALDPAALAREPRASAALHRILDLTMPCRNDRALKAARDAALAAP